MSDPNNDNNKFDGCSLVSDETVFDFARDGVVVLRNVVSAEELRRLERGVAYNLAHPGPLAGVASTDADPGRFFEDFCSWERIPEYQDFVRHSRLPAIAAQLIQSQQIRLYHDHVLVKECNTVQHTAWHQDQPYYNIEGRQNVSFWVPLDFVPKESSLQFVLGSQQPGIWYLPRTFLSKQAKWFPEGSLPEVPDMSTDAAPPGARIASWSVQPGDVLAFHMLTLHGSAGTVPRRRAYSVRYIGDDIRHAPRSWRTSPEFPKLHDLLPAGAALDHPLFPVVYDRHPRKDCVHGDGNQ